MGSVNRSRVKKAHQLKAKRATDGVDVVVVAAAAAATGNAMARRRSVRPKTGLSRNCIRRPTNSTAHRVTRAGKTSRNRPSSHRLPHRNRKLLCSARRNRHDVARRSASRLRLRPKLRRRLPHPLRRRLRWFPAPALKKQRPPSAAGGASVCWATRA